MLVVITTGWYIIATKVYMSLYNCYAGVCYGFQVMRVSESPNTPFAVLFERFKQGTVCTYRTCLVILVCHKVTLSMPFLTLNIIILCPCLQYTLYMYNSAILIVVLASHNIIILLHVAPSVVIYDNGCNLHQYMLNHEPAFFENTWVLVDRFHWPNHTGQLTTSCDPVYCTCTCECVLCH